MIKIMHSDSEELWLGFDQAGLAALKDLLRNIPENNEGSSASSTIRHDNMLIAVSLLRSQDNAS